MAKDYFLIVDTETTQNELVADFGAVLVDRKGNVIKSLGCLVHGIFTDSANHPLFFDSKAPANSLWSKGSADKRYASYCRMVEGGSRIVASVGAINRWLDKVNAKYKPILTSYNLAFDVNKCANTGIDLNGFEKRFCLWSAAYTAFAFTKQYRAACLALHAFNAPTVQGNMTFKTNAETMARFVLDNFDLADEPHTALEDAKDYEVPILVAVLKKLSVKKVLTETRPYSWRDCQVKDWFKP